MTSILGLELRSPELIVATISEKEIVDRFPWEFGIGVGLPAEMRFLDRLAKMFDIDMSDFYFNHEWQHEFERKRGELEELVHALHQPEFSEREVAVISSFVEGQAAPHGFIQGLLDTGDWTP